MLVGEATDAAGDFQRRPPDEHVKAHAGDLPEEMSPADLRAALERTHDVNVKRIGLPAKSSWQSLSAVSTVVLGIASHTSSTPRPTRTTTGGSSPCTLVRWASCRR